jgi:hypothetical protein
MTVFLVKKQFSPLFYYTYTFAYLLNIISLWILVKTLCALCDIQIRHEAQGRLEIVSYATSSVQESSIIESYRVMGDVGAQFMMKSGSVDDKPLDLSFMSVDDAAIIKYSMRPQKSNNMRP